MMKCLGRMFIPLLLTVVTTAAPKFAGATSVDEPWAMTQVLAKLAAGLKQGALTSKMCRAFLKTFKTQKQLVHLKPLIHTNDYHDTQLQAFLSRCPKLRLPQLFGFHAHFDTDGLEGLSDEEIEPYADNVYYGTKHFRLYAIDTGDATARKLRHVFYFDTVVRKGELGETPFSLGGPAPAGVNVYSGGAFKVVDFDTCTVSGETSVNWGPSSDAVPSYNGLVRYHGDYYIFDLTPLGDTEFFMNLWAYRNEWSQFENVCGFSTLDLPKGVLKENKP